MGLVFCLKRKLVLFLDKLLLFEMIRGGVSFCLKRKLVLFLNKLQAQFSEELAFFGLSFHGIKPTGAVEKIDLFGRGVI